VPQRLIFGFTPPVLQKISVRKAWPRVKTKRAATESTPDVDSGEKAGLWTGMQEGYHKLKNKGRTRQSYI
jgi:hypothetical protein